MSLEVDELVALAVVAAVSLLLVLVPPGNPSVFVVLTLIALLVVRTLAGLSASSVANTALEAFIGGGLVLFVGIVLQRVFDILAFG